jgi:hypothetical protein
LPPGHEEPWRLGRAHEAWLWVNRRLEFGKGGPEPEAVEKMADLGAEGAVPEMTQAPAALDPHMLQMLGSLRRAAWFVVCLLALIFIATLWHR